MLCVGCDEPMTVAESPAGDGEGSLAIVFRCGRCGQAVAMLTNPAETQLVTALGVRIGPGGDCGPPAPLRSLRAGLEEVQENALLPGDGEPVWTEEALARLAAAPSFVQGMIRKAYADYARRHGLREITPAVMDAARRELGMG